VLPPHIRLAYDGLQLAFDIAPDASAEEDSTLQSPP